MSDRATFEWALAQNLAYRIRAQMDRFSKSLEDFDQKTIALDGLIMLGNEHFSTNKQAYCEFKIRTNWMERIPTVLCKESWIMRGSREWHVSKDGALCFEFELNWGNKLKSLVEKYTHGLTADYAASWLLNSTRSLLNRHLFAFREGIKFWDESWDYWPHGYEAASKDFFESLKSDETVESNHAGYVTTEKFMSTTGQNIASKAVESETERSLSHAKDGYKNAQEVIRFIDTKSTYFAGAALILVGFTMQLLKQYFELPAELKTQLAYAADYHPWAFFAIRAIAAFSMFFGVLALWSAVFSLVARPTKKNSHHIDTILFPFFTGKATDRDICQKIVKGMTEKNVAQEYACQIWNVGLILQKKVRRNRWAAGLFLVQIALLTIGGIILVFCIQSP